ncbi:MAG: hypothetical protein V4733_10405 [Verrucomicrobiota bacterium]
MHRFPTRTSIYRLRVCVVSYVLGHGLLVVSLLAVILLMSTGQEREWVFLALGGMGAGALLCFCQWALGTRIKCPICRMPVMGKTSCSRHRKATRTLGSYRLPVVNGVLFSRWFRCPYCNEPSELKLREKFRG